MKTPFILLNRDAAAVIQVPPFCVIAGETLASDATEGKEMNPEILRYNEQQEPKYKELCDFLVHVQEIDRNLPEPERKIWHAHPVWFLNGNPIVGYSRKKPGKRLMFWSGADFRGWGRRKSVSFSLKT